MHITVIGRSWTSVDWSLRTYTRLQWERSSISFSPADEGQSRNDLPR